MGPGAAAYPCRNIVNDSKLYDMKHEVRLTTKALTVDDLKNTDHVGFVDSGNNKGYICQVGNGYLGICVEQDAAYGNICYGGPKRELTDAILSISKTAYTIKRLYRFDTRRELYQWLADVEPINEKSASAENEFDVEGLDNHLGNIMSFDDYRNIPGKYSKDKAEYLINLVKPFIK